MDHAYYKDRISAYLDGALPPYEQKAIGEHLAQCAECRGILDKLRALNALIDQQSGLGENEYWERQAQKIEQRLGIAETQVTRIQPTRTWQGVIWKLAAAAASIMIVGVIGFYSWESIRDKTERPPIEMAPAIVTPRSTQPEPESAGDKGTPAETTESAKEPVVSQRKVDDTENYKRPVVRSRSATGEVQERMNRAVIEKTGTLMQETMKPPQRVDNLLKSASGEKIQTDSAISIRGGRAGEVSSQIDSTAAAKSEPAPNVVTSATTKSPKPAVVPFSDLNLSNALRRPEVRATASDVGPADSLKYWQAILASLEEMSKLRAPVSPSQIPTAKLDSSLGIARMGIAKSDRTKGKASMPTASDTLARIPVSDSAAARLFVSGDSLRLRACYQIARLSTDATEVAHMRQTLLSVATDVLSPLQVAAQAYLDSLERR